MSLIRCFNILKIPMLCAQIMLQWAYNFWLPFHMITSTPSVSHTHKMPQMMYRPITLWLLYLCRHLTKSFQNCFYHTVTLCRYHRTNFGWIGLSSGCETNIAMQLVRKSFTPLFVKLREYICKHNVSVLFFTNSIIRVVSRFHQNRSFSPHFPWQVFFSN